jgi:hypothetical protein
LSDLNLSSARRLIAPPKSPADQSAPTKGKSEKPKTEKYRSIENDLIACLKDLGEKAESYAAGTAAALNDTVEDIKIVIEQAQGFLGASGPAKAISLARCLCHAQRAATPAGKK